MQARKPAKSSEPAEFRPWTTVCFRTQEARDKFVCVVSTLPDGGVEAEVVQDDNRSATVRWRPGKFLELNDVAYAHGGKINVVDRRGLYGL